jgi:hypothetical protein
VFEPYSPDQAVHAPRPRARSGTIRLVSHAARDEPVTQARTGHVVPAVLALVVGVVAVFAPRYGHDLGWLATVVALQALLIWAFVLGTAIPGRIGGLLLSAGAAATADGLLLADKSTSLAPMLTVYGLLFPVLFLHQLARGVVRARVTESLAGVAAGAVAAAALAPLLELRQVSPPVASAALLAGAAGLLGGRVLDLLSPGEAFGEGVFHGLVGVVGATVAGGVAAIARLRHYPGHGDPAVSTLGAGLLGAGIGVTVGLVAVGAAYVAVTAHPRRTPFASLTLPVLKVLLPLAATTPVAYLLGLVVTG